MNTHHITRLLSAGLLIAVLAMGRALDWPVWLWFLLPALCAGALLIDMRVPRPDEGGFVQHPEPQEAEAAAPVESPYQETSVVVVPVESAVADCPFLFSATVWWRLVDEDASWSHRNPAALASTSVLRRVQRMTSAEHPQRCTFLEHFMEGVLGMPAHDDEGLVIAFATDIRLVLRPKDRDHLDELDGLRKAVAAWEGRRQHERNLREYLGDDVLRSPGSAVVWWMSRHEEEIDRAVEMIAPLTVLSAAANDEEIPQEYRDLFQARGSSAEEDPTGGFDHPEPIGEAMASAGGPGRPGADPQTALSDQLSELLGSLGIDEGSAEGEAFLHRCARASEAVGRPEAAESIRRTLRGDGGWGGATASGPFDGSAPEPPSAPGGPAASGAACSPPPHDAAPDGHASYGAQPHRTTGWQVTPEGAVSEAAEAPESTETPWQGPDVPRQPGRGPNTAGDEWWQRAGEEG
ncbi:hypothetical protein ACIP6P_09400 [Streptomyces sp. NPDC088729]|uniref:hypothetical protein n=1 Tax=Streptomyces sp. NPDC088729 TaxID=3365876 RepID=UPI0037F67721